MSKESKRQNCRCCCNHYECSYGYCNLGLQFAHTFSVATAGRIETGADLEIVGLVNYYS